MKFVPIHHGQIKDCKLVISNVDKWRGWLMKLDGKKVRFILEENKNPRSLKQNAFYWAYLNIIEDETGNDADDIHEIAKRKFLPARVVTFKGEDIKLPATSTKLDSLAFSEYMDKIAAWTGVAIPDPEQMKL